MAKYMCDYRTIAYRIDLDVFYYCKLITVSKPSQFLCIYAYWITSRDSSPVPLELNRNEFFLHWLL